MFKPELTLLVDNLAVLRGFVDAIAPVLLERGEQTVKSRADALAPLGLLLARAAELRGDDQPEAPILPKDEDLQALETRVRERFAGSIIIEPSGEKGLTLRIEGPDVPKLEEALKDVMHSFSQTRLLYQRMRSAHRH